MRWSPLRRLVWSRVADGRTYDQPLADARKLLSRYGGRGWDAAASKQALTKRYHHVRQTQERLTIALERLEGVNAILPPWGFADYALYLSYAGVIAVVLLIVGFWTFGRIEADFAQEL